MKKTRLWLSVLIVMLFSCLLTAFTACGGDKKEENVVEIQLNHQTYSLDLHEQVQLVATTKNTEGTVTFQSSAPDVATVDESGLVKSVKVGKSTITAKVEDKSAACEITVTNSGTAPVLEVSLNTLGINKDAEFTVDASVTYKGAAVSEAVTYTWAVSQGAPSELISLTPSADGKSVVVKGLAYGETSFDVSTVLWGVPLKQTVAVKVCNTDISFDVSGYELCEGGYKTSLALVATDDYETTSTPAVTVKNKGTVVPDAEIVWTLNKEGIVSVESGVISAVTAGEVVLTGSYDNNYFKLYVTVIRPEITLSEVTVETTKATLTLAAGDTIEGTVSKVTIGDDTNVYDKTESGVISLKKDLLPKQATQLGEGKTIVVETEKAIYSVPANIYTQIIRTKQELADWGTLAKAANDNAKIWDGYFVLGNNIDFGGDEYRSFISWANTETLDCTSAGFKGVFDGKGYIIDDIVINPEANGGFIGMLYTSSGGAESGILRNVAFTNAVSKGNGGFVVSSGGGKVSNVYVSLNELKGGRNPDRSGVFFTRDAVGWAARVTDCFVEIKSVEQNDYTFAIGAKHRRTGMIRNVYAVGYDNAFFELSDASWDDPADVYGAYADYASFLAAEIDFSAWDTDFWKIVGGIPYPKNLDESKIPEMKFTDLQATVSATNRIYGTAVDLAGKTITFEGLYGTYEATIVGGKITVNNIIKGSYTAKMDGFSSVALIVADEEPTLKFVYNGQQLNVPITTEDFSFWGTPAAVSKGEMDLPEQYGQYQVKLGSIRQNHVITKGTYQNVVIDAMFSSSYGAYANTTGILLQFADGKGILLGFQDQDGIGGTNFKLTYRTDNESYKFGMTDTLTGWVGDNGELAGCKPMKQEWKEKFDSENGLRLTLIRNGNVLLTYVDGTLVNTYELPAEYQDSACKVGFFSNWGACDIPFAIGGTLADVDVTVSGIDSLEHGTANLSQSSYKLGDKIVLNIVPNGNYKAIKVTVNGADKTSDLLADGTLLLGYAVTDVDYTVAITLEEPVTLTATVSALKIGETVNLKGQTVTLVGSNGTFRGEVGENGAFSVENAYKGVYTAKLEGYLDVQVTFDGATAPTVTFEYDRFEGSGAYDVSNQNKANASISVGKLDQAWAITKDKYDDVSVTATFKSSYGSYKGFMGIQLVFDNGNGVMLVLECTNGDGAIHADQMKLCFGTDCWQKKFAITGKALTEWVSVAEPLNSDMAAAFGSAGLEITLVRKGNALHVMYDGAILKTITIDSAYVSEKCRIAFYSCWGECEIPFVISGTLPDSTVSLTGADSLTNGTVALAAQSYNLCDAIVLNVAPANGYKLKNITVDGKNMTANVVDGKLFLGYATAEVTYAITAAFIEEKDNYDVTFSYDTTKYTADGLEITLTKGSDTKTVTLGSNAVVNGLAVGEWAATARFGGMTVSLGNFDIQVDEYFVDLGRVFGNSVKNVNLADNTFAYATGNQQNATLNVSNVAAGNAFFAFKLKFDKEAMAAGKNWNCFGVGLGIGDKNYIAPLMYNSDPNNTNDYENGYWYEEPTWGGMTAMLATFLDGAIRNALKNGDEVIIVWAYNAETGSMDIYAGTTAQNIIKIGTLYSDKMDKNATITSVTLCDPWGGSVKSDINVELNYGATLNEALGLTESE